MRFAFIAEKAEFGVTRLCRTLAVSRAGFYAWRKRVPSAHQVEDDRLRVQIHEAHRVGRGVYGRPRIHRALRKGGVFVSGKRVTRLMLEEGLVGRTRRKYRCTTMSDHDQPVAPNILDQVFIAAEPNQRWVGDTTELMIPNGRLFLAVILDLFSRFVVGWALSAINDRHLTLQSARHGASSAVPGRRGSCTIPDQGATYASPEDYQAELARHRDRLQHEPTRAATATTTP